MAYHFVRDMVAKGTFVMKYIQSAQNIADVFTKALTGERYAYLCAKLGLKRDVEQ